jgi:hypothetical protein
MTESGDSRYADDDVDRRPAGGDPNLELFGHGWAPDPSTSPETYVGRHRAPE